MDEGNTIPFIARYRKEMTKGASDEQLRDFYELYSYTKNLEARKQDVIRLIEEKGLMTDELRLQILLLSYLISFLSYIFSFSTSPQNGPGDN